MRPRTELIVGVGTLLMIALGAAVIGARRARPEDDDPRRSTFLAGPQGARGLADALLRLGVTVTRSRSRFAELPARPDTDAVVAVLAPALEGTRSDAQHLLRYVRDGGAVLLAGSSAGSLMQSFGYDVKVTRDSIGIDDPDLGARSPSVHAVLTTAVPDTGNDAAERDTLVPVRTDVVRRTRTGAPVIIRVSAASGGSATLVADGALFGNRALRDTGAGELVVGLVVGQYGHVTFDEFHQGFGPSGSLGGAALEWSVRSPWGWALWQLALVGLIALGASAIRFGPARHVIERRRRSPIEHVKALATALAAAGGHDAAIQLQIQGLRRRLARGPTPPRAPAGPWLAELAANVRTPRARAAVGTLQELTRGPQPADAVLRAANAVEEVWQDLTT